MVIAVDMTDYVPGGVNGGIVPLTLATIEAINKDSIHEIIILTTDKNHSSLVYLENQNIKCFCVNFVRSSRNNKEKKQQITEYVLPKNYFKEICKIVAKMILPYYIYEQMRMRKGRLLKTFCKCILPYILYEGAKVGKRKVKNILSKLSQTLQSNCDKIASENENRVSTDCFNPCKPRLDDLGCRGIDLLYCPFTAINFDITGVAVVSTINDIQHRFIPYFFSQEELNQRNLFYEKIVAIKPYLVAISEFTRKTFIEVYHFSPESIITIHPAVQGRLDRYDGQDDVKNMERFHLSPGKFLFYPANFWKHKNHKVLLLAFSILLQRGIAPDIKLVLTGFPVKGSQEWNEIIKRMNLDQNVVMLGYVSDSELATLYRNCKLMVFPSLFEGFGIPVTEAMAMGTPFACSNVTSLPEVAGDCAFYFDPYNPESIANTVAYMLKHEDEVCVKKGQYEYWLQNFSVDNYVNQLLNVFEKAVQERNQK